jgi:glycosyltransferase involved in cell wall biosynthesis
VHTAFDRDNRRAAVPPDFAGHTLLCLGTHAWDAHWTPVQQVMVRLAPRNRVIYLEPFHPPLAWLLGKHRLLAEQRTQGVARLREVADNLLVYRPGYPYLPRNMRSPLAARLNAPLYRREIAALLRRLDVRKPWLWSFFAQSLSVLDLEFEHVIYDCVDEWPAFFPHPQEKRFVTAIDDALCRRAELVFVGSAPLLETKGPLNRNTHVVNHAADIAHFGRAADAATTVAADLAAIPTPRVGFVGMMDRVRFDVDLIEQLARQGKYQVVLIGGYVDGAEQTLPRLPNVHRLGMRPVSALPGYLKGLDVCIMPYRLNEATRNIYPLKLHEYLATGKPVVTTAIPAVQEFRHLMYVADNHADFVRHVDTALAEQDTARPAARRACAREHSWEKHVARKIDIINEVLL